MAVAFFLIIRKVKRILTVLFSIFFSLTFLNARDSTAVRIIEEADRHIGAKYRYGANGPERFDCSGFTRFIFSNFGYSLGRSSSAQALDGRAIPGGVNALKMGDILVFGGRRATKSPGHVGIFIEYAPDSSYFSFIHASTHSGVIISRSDELYYARRFLCARRILPDSLCCEAASDTTFALSDTTAAVSFLPTVSRPQEAEPVYHIVKKGDNLSAIARMHHTTVEELCRLNNITPKTILNIGRRLRVL